VPLAVLLLPTAYEATIGVQPWATVAVTIGFLLWIAVDARATVAAGVALLPLVLAPLAGHAQGWLPEVLGSGWFWTPAIGAVALLAAGTVGVRRQADIYRAH
jgi:hypothetical protein